MYELFFQKFNEKAPLTQQEQSFVQERLSFKKLRKKQYLLQEGDVSKHVCFVEQGALRSYVLDTSGNEHITAFALPGWTMSDLASFMRQEPATQNIDALEDSELVLISKSAHEELLQLPKYETYLRKLVTDGYIAIQKRTTDMISLSLEDRYKSLIQMYPSIVKQVPQHMIASFMGLSPETLSRLRSRMAGKK